MDPERTDAAGHDAVGQQASCDAWLTQTSGWEIDVNGELGWPIWIGVVTEDLEATRRFYRDALGLAELESGPQRVKLDGGSGRMVEVVQATSDPTSSATGYQVGFAVDDVEAVRQRLVDAGVDVLTEVQGGERSGSYWCYFRDPDGNVFQVTQEIDGGDE